ncbi:hypothetical protein PO909_008520, partial [Leuciscus waleckii]
MHLVTCSGASKPLTQDLCVSRFLRSSGQQVYTNFLAVTMLQEGNLTLNESCKIHDGILSPFVPIGYIVICCIGLLCNTITLYIFFLRWHTDSSMAVYMRHLALADTLLVLCL